MSCQITLLCSLIVTLVTSILYAQIEYVFSDCLDLYIAGHIDYKTFLLHLFSNAQLCA